MKYLVEIDLSADSGVMPFWALLTAEEMNVPNIKDMVNCEFTPSLFFDIIEQAPKARYNTEEVHIEILNFEGYFLRIKAIPSKYEQGIYAGLIEELPAMFAQVEKSMGELFTHLYPQLTTHKGYYGVDLRYEGTCHSELIGQDVTPNGAIHSFNAYVYNNMAQLTYDDEKLKEFNR